MADSQAAPSSTTLQGPLNSHPPDLPSPASSSTTIRRRDTADSTSGSDKQNTCRICRSEGTPDQPLYYPCKCSGSIKYVHQDCLMQWLAHSHKKHCELCKTHFRFTKLYSPDMPTQLPWTVFIRQALVDAVRLLVQIGRCSAVAAIWMIVLPFIVRAGWRWMFWVADAGWAREAFVRRVMGDSLEQQLTRGEPAASGIDTFVDGMQHLLKHGYAQNQTQGEPFAFSMAKHLLSELGLSNAVSSTSSNSTRPSSSSTWPHLFLDPSSPPSDQSILAGWTYLSQLTPNPVVNRVILDIFEGQLITCVVITGFILVFLIREWVVQQQPLFNAEGQQHLHNALNAANEGQRQLREAAERVREDNVRLRRQQDLLEQARQRLLELQQEAEEPGIPTQGPTSEDPSEGNGVQWAGWENLSQLMDTATSQLHKDAEAHDVEQSEPQDQQRAAEATDNSSFRTRAADATAQIRAAGLAGIDLEKLADNVSAKLASCSEFERKAWRAILIFEIEKAKLGRSGQRTHQEAENVELRESGTQRQRSQSDPRPQVLTNGPPTQPEDSHRRPSTFRGISQHGKRTLGGGPSASGPISPIRPSPRRAPSTANGSLRGPRPPMPDRDFSSRATQIQRLLEEAEGVFGPQDSLLASDALAIVRHLDDSPSSPMTSEQQPDDDVEMESNEIPITNAGPEAKINIKRSGKWKGKAKSVVPPPEVSKQQGISKSELKKRLEEDQALARLEAEIGAEDEAEKMLTAGDESQPVPPADGQQNSTLNAAEINPAGSDNNDNPFHPNGPDPEHLQEEDLGTLVASAFQAESGLDEAKEAENLRQIGLLPNGENDPNDGQPEERAVNARPGTAPPSRFQNLADWFWGDVQPAQQGGTQPAEPAPPPYEERVQANVIQDTPGQTAHEAAGDNEEAAPPSDDEPEQRPADVDDHGHEHGNDHVHQDPEVLAAAQEAGLDAEAVEDAEDLEGILELVGLQGPLIGLLQTSTFCLVLITGTVCGAVGLPYVWGKLVLSFVGSPMWFLVSMPLKVASFTADLVVDTALLIGSWVTLVSCLTADFLFAMLETWFPRLNGIRLAERISEFAINTATTSATRLQNLFSTSESADGLGLGLNWQFLAASVHAHASLKELQQQTNAVFYCAGVAITNVVNTISSGAVMQTLGHALASLERVPQTALTLVTGASKLDQYITRPVLRAIANLPSGAVVFQTPEAALDPSLVYWSTADRALAVLAGYIALALIAAVYVAMDTPLTRSQQGQKTEKVVRDTLRQAGGVLKVILIISIEMLVFPLYCGLLLDLAFLPLFQGASVATRWQFATTKPYLFSFVHWFVGTCYMFHFALFVGMCRKILRKGVLWFIRDPDDPTFHPVRDVLERNVTTQLRKIAFSALVYGALVILCLGGVIWSIGRVFQGLFPIHWVSTEPVLEFPLDMLVYQALTPLVVRLFKPSEAVNAMYAWWLRRCARVLRLSHFLFDERRKDEEGHVVRKSWRFLLHHPTASKKEMRPTDSTAEGSSEVYFKPDGKHVLTPCNDQYRPPKSGEAFLHADEDDVYVADASGKKNDHFAKVYVPPHFRLRVSLFMICLWMFSAFTGLCATLVPLVFGRQLLASVMPEGVRVNDIYAYSAGAYILGGALYMMFKGALTVQYLYGKTLQIDPKALTDSAKQFVVRAMKCAYLYGFIGVVLPALFAFVLHFYFILPLHTWAVSLDAVSNSTGAAAAYNGTVSVVTNVTDAASQFVQNATSREQSQVPILAHHTIHILQSYCLGLLYLRLAARMIFTAPASRAAEAWRRIIADGYLNPDIRLANRYLVAPVTLVAITVLLLPPLVSAAGLQTISALPGETMEAEFQTLVYRLSYPMAAASVVLLLATTEVSKATRRWTARIRDEVYLVGERLHNFGEKKPPAPPRNGVLQVYKI